MVIDYKDELSKLMIRSDLTEEELSKKFKLMEWFENEYIKVCEEEYEELLHIAINILNKMR